MFPRNPSSPGIPPEEKRYRESIVRQKCDIHAARLLSHYTTCNVTHATGETTTALAVSAFEGDICSSYNRVRVFYRLSTRSDAGHRG